MRKTIKRIVTLAFLGLMAVGACIAYSNANTKHFVDSANLEALTGEEETYERTCYDRYNLEPNLLHSTLQQFRSCEDCKHVDGYYPRNEDTCFD